MENSADPRGVDVVWGAAAIGGVIGLSPRQAFGLLDAGHLPARKVGGKWCARRSELLAHLSNSSKDEVA